MSRKKKESLPCRTFIETPTLIAEAAIQEGQPFFVVYDRLAKDFVFQKEFLHDAGDGKATTFLPLLLDDPLASFVKFPSGALEYGSEDRLLGDIRSFIRKWVDLPERYEKLAALYVMFTWCHDEFFEIPYLRIIADLGSGKTRLGLQVLGSVCYKAFATIAASTLSPIFRTLDFVGGTMVLDEADLGDKSDKTAELVQLLNSGYVKGMCIMRSEKSGDNFIAARYKVFGPKIIMSREHFKDAALESRCIELRITRTDRKDLPLSIDESLEEEGVELRNKLLLWRLRTYGTHRGKMDMSFAELDLPPRLKQLLLILSGTVSDPDLVLILRDLGDELSREHAERRGDTYEGEIVAALAQRGSSVFISCQELADELNEGADAREKKTPRSIGFYLRERLGLKPKRQGSTRRFGVTVTSKELIALTRTYGIPYEATDVRDDTAGGDRDLDGTSVRGRDDTGDVAPF